MKPVDLTSFEPIPEIDWARLAAYIDGEGCIRIAGVKGSTPYSRRVLYLEVTICNTDFRLTQWLKTRFGGSVWFDKKKANTKWAQKSAWVVSSRHAAFVLTKCLPYFLIKREQADVALAFQNTILTDRRYGCLGRPISLIDHQHSLKQQLSDLKGTSSRARKSVSSPTVN